MLSDTSDEFVDRVAQAVIDRIEQRDQVAHLVELVAARVMALQKEEAELQAAEEQRTEAQPTPKAVTGDDEDIE